MSGRAPFSTRTVDGWTITVWADPLREHSRKIIAIAPGRRLVRHIERLTPEDAESWAPPQPVAH